MIFVLLYYFALNVLYLLILKILFYCFGACTSDCQVFRVIFFNFLAPSVKMATKKQPVMEWTDDHGIVLLREMIQERQSRPWENLGVNPGKIEQAR